MGAPGRRGKGANALPMQELQRLSLITRKRKAEEKKKAAEERKRNRVDKKNLEKTLSNPVLGAQHMMLGHVRQAVRGPPQQLSEEFQKILSYSCGAEKHKGGTLTREQFAQSISRSPKFLRAQLSRLSCLS